MPFFGRPKSTKELIQAIYGNLLILNDVANSEKDRRKAVTAIASELNTLHELLMDKSDTRLMGRERDPDLCISERTRINEVITEVIQELINLNVLPLLFASLDTIDFESCKHVVVLFNHVMCRQIAPYNAVVKYLHSNPNQLLSLIHGYSNPERAIHYGAILRDACRHEALAEVVLRSPEFYQLFDYAQSSAFDVTTDAMNLFKALLNRHKSLVSQILAANYDEFFHQYSRLIDSENYVTKRLALKTLGELLLERHNHAIMKRYTTDAENLKVIMILLKSNQRQIAFEAFHCFKVFLTNPEKSPAVLSALLRNQQQLITFLSNFQTDRTDDIQFQNEKQYLINQISNLKALPTSSSNLSISHVGSTTHPT